MKKRLGSAILALFLALSVSTGAYAAGTGAALSLVATGQNGTNTVQVYLTAEGATNGKIEVSYDADVVELVDGEVAEESWIVSVNAEEPGLVSFAWVGSELSAEKACLLTLVFDVVDEEAKVAVYRAEVVELYASGVEFKLNYGSTVESKVWLNTGSSDTPSKPEEPVTPPAEPEEPVTPPAEPEEPVTPPSQPEIPVEPGDVEEPEVPFTDIDHWAKEYIETAYTAGLIKGTSDSTFSPEANITRGSFITLLYRLNGSPEVTGENPFTDVAEGEYYADAVIWAYTNGIVNGKTATEFVPNGDITRQELATMLMRYAKFTGESVDASADISSFADADEVADWAMNAVKWAVAENIISGRGAATLAPQDTTKRAEAATILVRFAGL